MKEIWKTTFHCDKCKRDIEGKVYSDNMDELPESEKDKALELLKHFHHVETHINCWKCGKHIKPEEIENLIAVENDLKPLCKDCSEYGIIKS